MGAPRPPHDADWSVLSTWLNPDPAADTLADGGSSQDDTPTLPGLMSAASSSSSPAAGDDDQASAGERADQNDHRRWPMPADVVRNFRGTLGHASEHAARIPTPGGIGLLLGILIFFVFAIVPVAANGKDTRLSLIWRTLFGQVSIPGDEPPAAPDGAVPDWFWGAVGGVFGAAGEVARSATGAGAGPEGLPYQPTPAPPASTANTPAWSRPRIPAYAYTARK